MRITSILAAITLTLGASSAYAACTTPSANGMPAGNIPILKMSAGSGSFGAAPSTDPATGGEMYFDTALSQMIWCDGTNWLRLDGTSAFNEPALTTKIDDVATVAEEAKTAATSGGGGGNASGADPVQYSYSFVYRGSIAAPCTGMIKESYIQRNGSDRDTIRREYIAARGDRIDLSRASYSGTLYCLN